MGSKIEDVKKCEKEEGQKRRKEDREEKEREEKRRKEDRREGRRTEKRRKEDREEKEGGQRNYFHGARYALSSYSLMILVFFPRNFRDIKVHSEILLSMRIFR